VTPQALFGPGIGKPWQRQVLIPRVVETSRHDDALLQRAGGVQGLALAIGCRGSAPGELMRRQAMAFDGQ